LYVEYRVPYVWIYVGSTSCCYISSDPNQQFSAKVGKVILRLHNREHSRAFYGKEMQSVVERKQKDHLTNTNPAAFQKAGTPKYLYVHRKPSFRFKVPGKHQTKAPCMLLCWACTLKRDTELNSLHLFQLFRIIHICMIQ